MALYVGTGGDDPFTGTNLADEFDVIQGGNDTIDGRGGDDATSFEASFTADDFIDGGAGNDEVTLYGSYLSGVMIGSATIHNVEKVVVAGDFNYALKFEDSAVTRGRTMTIDGQTVTDGHRITIDAQQEKSTAFVMNGGAGSDVFLGGGGDDTLSGAGGDDILSSHTGHDTIFGGDGDDFVVFASSEGFDHFDHVDGGNGHDVVQLQGNFGTFAPTADMMVNVEQLNLRPGYNYHVDLTNLSASADGFTVDATTFDPTHHVEINAAGLTHYVGLDLIGSAGNDVLTGGRNGNTFTGGAGADTITCGRGIDLYAYSLISESSGAGFDTIVGFDAEDDIFLVAAKAVDRTVNHGRLSNANFDNDLAAAVSFEQLTFGHAVLFKPDSGSHAGEVFLIIDQNGDNGHQIGEDYVMRLEAPHHLGDLGPGNFATLG